MQSVSRLLSFFLLLGLSLVPFAAVAAQSDAAPYSQSSAYDLIAAVNALRVANGLPAYNVSPILMGTAQAQANYMAAIGSVTHSGPSGIGLTQRLLNAGYPLAGDLSQGGFRAENITGGNKTAAQAVQEWTGDAPHLNTMLSPHLTEIGAGVARVGDRYFMVIDCAQPTTSGQPQAYTPGPGEPVVGTSAPGDFIVPITTSTPDESGLVYHEVQYGQTLWAIAIAYGVKIDEIRALNNLGPTIDIYQGDRLLVRKDAPPVATATLLDNSVIPTRPPQITSTVALPELPASTLTATSTLADMAGDGDGNNSVVGVVVGIILVSLLVAGLFTWMGSQKST